MTRRRRETLMQRVACLRGFGHSPLPVGGIVRPAS
jgi:hypothetical protein